jgi:hypothetical protein
LWQSQLGHAWACVPSPSDVHMALGRQAARYGKCIVTRYGTEVILRPLAMWRTGPLPSTGLARTPRADGQRSAPAGI